MNKSKITVLSTATFAVLVFFGTIWSFYLRHHPQPTSDAAATSANQPSYLLGGDFSLESTRGKLSLADFEGKFVLLYFGFTNCPDVCPASLARIAHALKQLDPIKQQQIQTLLISVDPERDTPEKLQTYLSSFSPDFIGLTGEPEEIKRVALSYGAYAHEIHSPDSATETTLDHSTKIYLLDKQGKLLKIFDHDILPDKLATELTALF